MRCRVPALVLALFFLTLPTRAGQPKESIVVFAPHPDDETLGCGCRLAEAVARGASVTVVFLTNGDACLTGAASHDLQSLGEARQREAGRAAERLGIREKDLIFLGYPDTCLGILWEQRGPGREPVRSPATGLDRSAYAKTWGNAGKGYTGQNVLADITRVLSERKPDAIYLASPLDNHSDHAASAKFILSALARGRAGNALPKLFYYRVHVRAGEKPLPGEAQPASPRSLEQKRRAMSEYQSQQSAENGRRDFQDALARGEWIACLPADAAGWEKYFSGQWEAAAAAMRSRGYTVNLGPVADICADIDDSSIDLVKKDRIYSDDPRTVDTLVSLACAAMDSQGVVPVVKHFPGLGSVRLNTHQRLAVVRAPKDQILASLSPYRRLIAQNMDHWVMTSHAVYPALDSVPASLSRAVQTGLLRESLGFRGLIISDELMNMQALEEFCARQGITQPYTGEMAATAFSAGTDLALIYQQKEKDVAGIVSEVTEAVKRSLKKGQMTEGGLDESVARILKEKERIYNKPLAHLLKGMSLEERIAQKLVIEGDSGSAEACAVLGLGGVVAHDDRMTASCLKDSKIPPFVICQHEGGWVKEQKLGIASPSAYVSGREFELASGAAEPARPDGSAGAVCPAPRTQKAVPGFSRMEPGSRKQLLARALETIGEVKGFFDRTPRGGDRAARNPDRFSPFSLDLATRQRVMLNPFDEVPFEWLKKFEDRNTALCAYGLIADGFAAVSKGGVYLPGNDQGAALGSLESAVQKAASGRALEPLRVLCIAAHPDDEDGEALSYFKKRFNAKTCLLYATKGEGGENALGDQLYAELGMIRMKEARLAAGSLGVDKVYFLNKEDFGYCSDPEEAKKAWGAADTARKIAYFFRLVRPDVVVTKHFFSDPSGQHRALLELAGQAFDAAGNASLDIEGLPPWQPEAFYARDTRPEDYPLSDLAVNREEMLTQDRSIGQACVEAAAFHASQRAAGFASGEVYYRLVRFSEEKRAVRREEKAASSVPSGVPGIRLAPGLTVGLVEAPEGIVSSALSMLGVDTELLDERSLRERTLAPFKAIVLSRGASQLCSQEGIRARLAAYMNAGGTVVVLARDTEAFSPYQLKLRFDPVTDENAPVAFLEPGAPLLAFPNRISEDDFRGWKQDRCVYLPAEPLDPAFEELLSLDRAGSPARGAYLFARYGKGNFVISTLSWFRQLRESNPGALRNLANMISLPTAPSE